MKMLTRKSPFASGALVCMVAILVLEIAGGAAAQTEQDKTQAAMLNIFQALTRAYTYGLDSEAYGDAANRQPILSSLRALAAASDQLEKHGAPIDPTFAYLEGSLAHDAGEALRRYERGEYTGSRYVLTRLTHNCMTCHARLRGDAEFEMGSMFLEQANVQSLPPFERASVEVAVRQFDDAFIVQVCHSRHHAEFLRDAVALAQLAVCSSRHMGPGQCHVAQVRRGCRPDL